MCILCVVHRWSRRVSAMVLWFVLVLLLLWASSQFLPPGFRFEITPSRLACVLVLMMTLFWYEILAPQLSLWRYRRSARLKEFHRSQALELQKLRKTATRRCRNCFTAYRDQNPGCGRFMCTYCGHISKRPVLDLPTPIKRSGFIDSIVGRNGWICNQDCSKASNVNWGGPVPHYWIGDEQCTQKSCSGALLFACRLFLGFFSNLRRLCRKLVLFDSRHEGCNADNRASASKRGENGCSLQESRGEKTRRKAEEKRQARLEKEMHEEEERKQREEVARLVEERRKLRDEKLEAERLQSKCSIPDELERRKEVEKKRNDKKKDKDKGSNKSNSDGEDFEKSACRHSERKRDHDKKNENERRDTLKTDTDLSRSHNTEVSNGSKAVTNKPRYFGQMTSTFLSSSRGFTGASFFGRSTQNSTAHSTKASKPIASFVDHGSVNRRDSQVAGTTVSKPTVVSDDKMSGISLSQPAGHNEHPQPANPKKSWHQLFTLSAAVSPDPPAASSYHNHSAQFRVQSANLTNQNLLQKNSFDNQFNRDEHLSFNAFPPVNGAFNSCPTSHFPAESLLPSVEDSVLSSAQEEPELFEDPCYIPDPVFLLGPVSESLDDFPLDLGTGFVSSDKMEHPRMLKKVSASREISKPSPIESPMSKMRGLEERQPAFGLFPGASMCQESTLKLDEPSNTQQMWQMWGAPITQDALGLAGPASWLPSIGPSNLKEDDSIHPMFDSSIPPPVAQENYVLPSLLSPHHVYPGNQMTGGIYGSPGPGMIINDMWRQKASSQTMPDDRESHFLPCSLIDDIQNTNLAYDIRTKSKDGSSFEPSLPNRWFNKEWAVDGNREPGSSIPASSPHIGGLFSSGPDVQSVWSFSKKETI